MRLRLSHLTIVVLFTALALTCAHCSEAEWTLVRQGKPAAQIVIPSNAPAAVGIAAKDLQAYVKRMSGATLPIGAKPSGLASVTRIHIGADPAAKGSPTEAFSIATGHEGKYSVIRLSGGSGVGAMYATYRFLELLGVRFFHPEEDYAPSRRDVSVGSMRVSETPTYKWRGIQQHTLHAIPATKFLLENQTEKDLQRAYRYVDWLARNRQNYLFWWWVERVRPQDRTPYVRKIVDYAHNRGVNVGMVVGMPFNQQNSYNLMRGTACHSETKKWTGYLKQGVDEMAALGMDALCIFFGQSESGSFKEAEGCVTTVDGVQATVDRIEAVQSYIKEKHPKMQLTLWVHPTAGIRGNDSCPNYFLLPKLCSPEVGAAVHTTMFYNLFDPAPTYGNRDFNFLRDFAVEQAKIRPVWYWPESAYACGFDNDLPLFLPGYVTGRSKDARFLAGKAVAHITFSTGIEWNFWLVDYAVARYGWDPKQWGSDEVFSDFAGIFGAKAGGVVARALEDIAAANDQYLVQGAGPDGCNLMHMLDTLTMPRQLDALAGRSDAEVNAWRDKYLPSLTAMTARYATNLALLKSVRPEIGKDEEPWFSELLDSVEITTLRCRHQLKVADVYSKRVMNPSGPIEAIKPDLAVLAGLASQANAIKARRESHFRYPTGGPEGNYCAIMRPVEEWEHLAAKITQYASPKDLYPDGQRWAAAAQFRISIVGPVGTRAKVVVDVPNDFPVDGRLTLYAQVEDTDSPLEGAVEVAGKTFALPESGDSRTKIARIDLPAGLIKHGANELWFVFKDNVGGTTGGFYASSVCMAVPKP